MKTDPKTTAARAFVRSLNILLKFARLYGYDHTRTVEQLQIAWSELRTAVPEDADNGLLLGATGTQLLLDGVPLEGSPAEKQFAQLLSTAGLASLQFQANVTQEELAKLVHAFPTGKSEAGGISAAVEGRDCRFAGHPCKRDLLCGHGCEAERCQHGGATGGGVIRRRSRIVQEDAERSRRNCWN